MSGDNHNQYTKRYHEERKAWHDSILLETGEAILLPKAIVGKLKYMSSTSNMCVDEIVVEALHLFETTAWKELNA